jgi:hypothetical protein
MPNFLREEIFSYQHITFDVKIRLLHIKLHQEAWKRHTVNNHRKHKDNLPKTVPAQTAAITKSHIIFVVLDKKMLVVKISINFSLICHHFDA